ncbi:MAG: hypothetical protein V4539_13890 [Bacteroidota bacterium]
MDNHTYIALLTISNLVAVLQVIAARKWPAIAIWSFFLLFIVAGFANWSNSQHNPQSYMEFADLAWCHAYRVFISGWFAGHIKLVVGLIAVCQVMIGISMLLSGRLFAAGCIGAIIFLVAILPLGMGSGFPCPGIMAAAVFILLLKQRNVSLFDGLQVSNRRPSDQAHRIS